MRDWLPADWSAPGNIIAGTLLHDREIATLGLPGEPCWLQQVHGATVVVAEHRETPPRADGSVSCSPSHICAIRTADCLPVLLAAIDGTEVAAAHAGWRGLAAGVIEATVGRMSHKPGELIAWLGPAISQAAFEVGDEVRGAFTALEPADAGYFRANDRGRWQADLYGLAQRRLQALDVTSVSGGGYCTFTDTQRFYSYRRDPECGRMVSIAAIRTLEK